MMSLEGAGGLMQQGVLEGGMSQTALTLPLVVHFCHTELGKLNSSAVAWGCLGHGGWHPAGGAGREPAVWCVRAFWDIVGR